MDEAIPRWLIYGCWTKNNGTPKSSLLIGFSIIFTIHFGVPLFLETPICWYHFLQNAHLLFQEPKTSKKTQHGKSEGPITPVTVPRLSQLPNSLVFPIFSNDSACELESNGIIELPSGSPGGINLDVPSDRHSYRSRSSEKLRWTTQLRFMEA